MDVDQGDSLSDGLRVWFRMCGIVGRGRMFPMFVCVKSWERE